ncbi:hypothetical protein HIM_00343 [Hirsutella minnesotensis 3608]|nr:hypothetical protein HIM_00343 [Hirsutella minnesotensis 3608]
MNNPAAYTPLESLFLFQSLLSQGLDTGAFARISELLKNNALIRSGKTYDPARLTPDALEQLFLLLLRDELRSEAERLEGADGATSPASRKRKLGTPPLPSLKDASQHIEKLPALVDRLYARYRDHIVEEIREDERQFAIVQSHIQVLEKNEKERLAKAASQNGTPVLAPRDNKPTPLQAPGQSPMPPTPGAAPSLKRGPTPNTPVRPTKPPAPIAAQAPATTPGQPPSGPPPVRPSPILKAANGTAAAPQAPTHATPPASRPLQAPAQPAKALISPRPETVSKPKDATPAAPLVSTPTSVLKWERPYQPPQTGPAPSSGHVQHNVPTQFAISQKAPQLQPLPQSLGHQPPSTPDSTAHPRPVPGKIASNQAAGPLAAPAQAVARPPVTAPSPQPRPHTTTPVVPPNRPIQPYQAQHPPPRPIAAASPAPTTSAVAPAPTQKRPQNQPVAQPAQRPIASASPAPPSAQKDKPHIPSYKLHRPAIPEHIIRQAAGTPNAKRNSPVTAPHTPGTLTPSALTRGFGTKWASHSTPSTPGPTVMEPESPAYEPVSPPQRAASIMSDTPKTGLRAHPKRTPQPDPSASRTRGRPPRNAPPSATPSVSGNRRSQSVASQADELAMDHSVLSTKIKKEAMTPRPHDDAGETTTDESVHGRTHMATPGSVSSRLAKRKRPDTPPEPTSPSPMVLWTRGFTKVSSSALDQISSHRHANMFATGVREKDAPGYRQIVLQPQDITSIRAAIKQGNKAAVQAAANLPGGDPGTASVWLPLSEDLVPAKGIINSAQLERELVHIFCNAIMYNPDPDRGPGAAFMKRSQDEEEEVVGYHLDENGVVKNTRSMFVEVEKLLGDLRSAEKDRGVPPLSSTRQASVATPADDTAEDEDELAGDGNHTATSVVKRRRISTRG